jgi:hypothetical protein
MLSNVVYAPGIPGGTAAAETDEAPMSGLVGAIGPSTLAGAASNLVRRSSDWMVWLFVLLTLGLIGEVASRRLRGSL